jgi:hypothetical protein
VIVGQTTSTFVFTQSFPAPNLEYSLNADNKVINASKIYQLIEMFDILKIFESLLYRDGCTRWRGRLRHCATNRQVAGWIPNGVSGIFHLHNHFGRAMALVSTQPLKEKSTRNISWGVKAAGVYG